MSKFLSKLYFLHGDIEAAFLKIIQRQGQETVGFIWGMKFRIALIIVFFVIVLVQVIFYLFG